MELPPGLVHVIAQTRLFTDGRTYVILRLSKEQLREAKKVYMTLDVPFSALVYDKDEVTLILSSETWEQVKPMLDVLCASPDYRLITFDLTLDLGLVGYLAMISRELADAGISILPVSAFSRDHILVMEEDFDHAWEVLRKLIRSCQKQDHMA